MSVHTDDDLPSGRLDRCVEPGRNDSPGIVNHADVRNLLGVLAEQLTGPVVAQAITDQYRDLPTGIEILCEHRVEEFANISLLVAAGNDDRYLQQPFLLIAFLHTRGSSRPSEGQKRSLSNRVFPRRGPGPASRRVQHFSN